MTTGTKLIMLTLFVALFAFGQAKRLPNIDYLSVGYDIIRGNPHNPRGLDPGFKLDQIFSFTYNSSGTESSEANWEIPDSVTLARTSGCDLSFQSSDVSTLYSYQQSLEAEVNVEGETKGLAPFKGSPDFKFLERRASTSSDKRIYSAADCDVYRASINTSSPPQLHPDFIQALKTLPIIYHFEAYFDFLNTFGTHAILEFNMGARYGMMSTLSEKAYQNLNQEGITVPLAASALIEGLSGGKDTRTSLQKEWASKYASSLTSSQIISVGAHPVAGGDGVAWAKQVINQPTPLRYTLVPLNELLSPLYLRGALDSYRTKFVQQGLYTALPAYCNALRVRGEVIDCNRPLKSLSSLDIFE